MRANGMDILTIHLRTTGDFLSIPFSWLVKFNSRVTQTSDEVQNIGQIC